MKFNCINIKNKKNKQKIKSILIIIIIICSGFSIFQIIPSGISTSRNVPTNSYWFETDWSTPSNYTDSLDVDTNSSAGNIELVYGQWLYVTDIFNYRIVKMTVNGSDWTTYGTVGLGKGQFSYPKGIFYDDSSGYIYVTDSISLQGRIVKTKINGYGWTTYGTRGTGKGQFANCFGIYHDVVSDYLYIADLVNNRVVKTKMNGSGWTTLGSFGSGAGQFKYPSGIYYDSSSDHIYVADKFNHRIVRTKMDGSNWSTLGSKGNGIKQFDLPTDLYYDYRTGFLYVADNANNRLVKTMMNGSGWTTLGSFGSGEGQFHQPTGITYDSSTGYIYTVDWLNNRIVKTMMDGSGWTTFGSYGNGKGQFADPYDISISKLGYAPEGYLTSKYYDCGGSKGSKTINWTGTTPPGTSIKFQLRTANQSSNLTSKDFVGPNGTNSSYYNRSDMPIWEGHNDESWIQYRVYLSTTNHSLTPILRDVKITYNFIPNRPILVSPGNNTWTSDNTPEFKWRFKDIDTAFQGGFQWQATSDDEFKIIDYDSDRINSTEPSFIPDSIIADGVWYWRIRTKDSDGDWGPFSSPWKLTIDSTPPNSTIKILKNNGLYQSLDSISGIASDPPIGIGVDSVEIAIECLNDSTYWDRSNWISTESWLLATGKDEWTFDSRSVIWTSISSYSIKSRAIDGLFNVEFPGPCINITIDSDKPSSAINYPLDNSYLNNLEIISGVASDLYGAGIDKVELSIKQISNDKYWTGKSWEPTKTWLLTYGTINWTYYLNSDIWTSLTQYTIISRATDNVSNIEVPSNGIKFIFDTDKPSAIIEFPKNNSFVNEVPAIFGTAEDFDGSGINTVEITIRRNIDNYYWDGSAWVTELNWLIVTGKTNWTYNAKNIDWTTDNYYTVCSNVIDNTGNKRISWIGNTFMYDDKPPEQISISINNDTEFTNTSSVMLKLYSVDSGSGVSNMTFSTDGQVWTIWEQFILQRTFLLQPHDGVKSMYFKVRDRAGNIAESVIGTIILDSIPPNCSIFIYDNNKYTNSRETYLTLKAFDSLSGISLVSFSFDSIDWTSWRSFKTYEYIKLSSGDGEKIVYFRVKDRADNLAVSSDIILLDTTPPHSLIIRIDNGTKETKSAKVNLNLSAYDDLSGVEQMSFSLNNQDWTNWEPFINEKTITLSLNKSEQKISFRVKDRAGNIASPVYATIILNVTLPEQVVPIQEQSEFSFNIWILLVLIIIIITIPILVVIISKRKKKAKEEKAVEKVEVVSLTIKPQKTPALFASANQTIPKLITHQLSTANTTIDRGPQPLVTSTPVPKLKSITRQIPQLPPAKITESKSKAETITREPTPTLVTASQTPTPKVSTSTTQQPETQEPTLLVSKTQVVVGAAATNGSFPKTD